MTPDLRTLRRSDTRSSPPAPTRAPPRLAPAPPVVAGIALALLLLSPAVPAGPSLAAQEEEAPADTSEVVEIEPIEVWVIPEKSQARRAETFSLFTEEAMRRSDEVSPYEFFKSMPGVNLVQGHALGFGLRNPVAGRIQIRGIGRKAGPVDFRARGVLLLMDGVPDFSVTHGHPLPDMFSRSYVSEIEVVKGPSSVRHGWAQAGAVLMRSKDPRRMGSSGYAAGSFGAFETTQDQLHYNYRWGDGFVQLSGAARHSDGHRPNSRTEAYDGRVRFAQAVSEGIDVIGSFRGGTNNWEIPGPVGGEPGVGGRNDWYIADGGVGADLGEGWDLSGKVWLFDADVEFDDGLLEPNEAWGTRWKVDGTPWEGGTLTVGTDVLNYRVGRGTDEVTKTDYQTEVAPYVWASHDVVTEAGEWILSAGLRYTNNEQFGDDVSPEVGVVWLPVPETSIRTRVSHGFRAPNPFEFAFGSTANPDLDATDLWQYELGVNQGIGDHVTVDVVGWIQEGSNMITTVFDPVVQDERAANTGEFSHKGVEAQLAVRTVDGWHGGVAGTTMDLENDTALVPLNTLDVWVGWDGPSLWARLDGRWATELHQRDDSEGRLPNYVLANLRAGYRFGNGFGLRANVENLFDEDYELFAGWPMPRIALYAGVDYVF